MKSFTELNISEPVLKALTELGFENPSPIQVGALPILLGDRTDFIGLAATGTGKTAAYVIPLLEKIQLDEKHVQALILCPTRELALQVTGQIELLGKYMGIKVLTVYGGTGYGDQISGLKRGVHIVVGTPGRIVDHIDKKTLKLGSVSTVILDEADEMISMGFKEDMTTILSQTTDDKNTWLFSATMDREVRKVADEFLTEPQKIEINRTEMIPEGLKQIYFITSESNKQDVLFKLIDAAPDFYGVVFCQTKALCVDLVQILRDRAYKADCLHGDMDQNARERTMKAFREKKVALLICTDVAARGIDVKDITHVINYSIPRELDNYVHRIGRTARNGKEGFAFSLVTPSHRALIPRIEKMTKSKMVEGKIPTRREIGEKKLLNILTTFQAVENTEKATALLADAWKKALKDMDKEEIAARFLSLQFPEVFTDKKEEKTISEGAMNSENNRRFGGERVSRGRDGGGFGGRSRDGARGGFAGGRDRDGGSRGGFGGRSRDGARGGFGGGRSFGGDRPERSSEGGAPRSFGGGKDRSESAPSYGRSERGTDRTGFPAGMRVSKKDSGSSDRAAPRERSSEPKKFSGFGAKRAPRN